MRIIKRKSQADFWEEIKMREKRKKILWTIGRKCEISQG
jgi:hypothetical protein